MIKIDYTYAPNKSGGNARTLSPEDIGTHKSGWTIEGDIVEDWYRWVNDFSATHEKYGFVRGNFEGIIEASGKRALAHFLKHHFYNEWDYQDI